jgi:hypothetical protein
MCRQLTPCLFGALVTLLALETTPAAAQSLWIPRDRDHAVLLEFLRPNQEGIDGDLFSGAGFLSGRISVSRHAALVAELPFAREKGRLSGGYGYGYYYYPYYLPYYPSATARSSAGNVYIGVESKPHSIPIFWELGFRLPLTSQATKNQPARITGSFADVTRSDAFQPHIVTVQTAFNVGEITQSRIEYRLRLSPVLQVASRGGGPVNAYAVHAWQIGYHGPGARIGSAISGRTRLTHSYGNITRSSTNQLELHADFLSGRIRPGLDLRLPLGLPSDSASVVLGASISGSW